MSTLSKRYCSVGRHPNWRMWKSRYDMRTAKWEWLGDFCDLCGEKVNTVRGDDSPHMKRNWRVRILRGELSQSWNIS